MVPAAGARDDERRSYMEKREAVLALGFEERAEPLTIRIAELTKRANVESEMASSTMEYFRQCLIAGRDGRYMDFSEEEK